MRRHDPHRGRAGRSRPRLGAHLVVPGDGRRPPAGGPAPQEDRRPARHLPAGLRRPHGRDQPVGPGTPGGVPGRSGGRARSAGPSTRSARPSSCSTSSRSCRPSGWRRPPPAHRTSASTPSSASSTSAATASSSTVPRPPSSNPSSTPTAPAVPTATRRRRPTPAARSADRPSRGDHRRDGGPRLQNDAEATTHNHGGPSPPTVPEAITRRDGGHRLQNDQPSREGRRGRGCGGCGGGPWP